mmetsp:Transcript_19642/g.54789  ORF Transcript_19642/g.54789 Transcript_19642/m.54789 type:complete len:200 (-) Transcript_19642:531-1130(-)|eukprot:CAMPEP_0202345862 /NCGR_PEP_ID=MMETSP1126-20121109/4911_1 /ASSEMBLY_ACC=CAM_ASM_000457 /TAXON_ID=3047 /ORGANISM="Dunaliella tertiolecta, Strain CCMP1320" /LENGTH=199 /DNA_ID=CAMNT_0048937211 /DNA_START=80 /DNA_END=679 /DNA_ORIENTATION=-
MLASKSVMLPQTRLPVASAAPRLPQQRLTSVRPAVCVAKAAGRGDNVEEQPRQSKLAMPFAAVLSAALITSAIVPDEAMAAKSQGRVGGSSGFRSSKAAQRAAPQQTTTTVNNTVIAAPAMAPPVYAPSPFGFGGFGFGGFSIMPTFVMPFPFFGGILQFFLLMFVVSVVFNVVRAIASNASNNNNSSGGKKDDGWGDL